jgi:hypothetical protein
MTVAPARVLIRINLSWDWVKQQCTQKVLTKLSRAMAQVIFAVRAFITLLD